MSHTPHELAEEFLDQVEKMHELRQKDAHFARLYDEYHAVNRAVYKAETLLEPTAPQHEADLRQKRVLLKDQIRAVLDAA
ncbi:MAG: DUF465 domain-containing protein [Paracoccaceae bacterium]|nr:DUF465 domain-containing protein [Paracoccaceae bacterium]